MVHLRAQPYDLGGNFPGGPEISAYRLPIAARDRLQEP